VRTRPYLQSSVGGSTLDSIAKGLLFVQPERSIFGFAYATVSGCAEFERRFGDRYWEGSHWVVGIDYGRTEPRALEFLSRRLPAGALRIHAGRAVVASRAFRPQRDFHLKAFGAVNLQRDRYALLSGSGNFSRAGLVNSTEMGVLVLARQAHEANRVVLPAYEGLEELYRQADPVDVVFAEYSRRWIPSYAKGVPAKADVEVDNTWQRFWIDVGYVTKNRGPDRPGNQIDMPRGVHRFFGMRAAPNIAPNTQIGLVRFLNLRRNPDRALRLGNNVMEKITLPLPETIDVGAYDGKIIEFERRTDGYFLRTYEPDVFRDVLAASRRSVSHEMGSHRRYGFRND
jgi:hypothetical protein